MRRVSPPKLIATLVISGILLLSVDRACLSSWFAPLGLWQKSAADASLPPKGADVSAYRAMEDKRHDLQTLKDLRAQLANELTPLPASAPPKTNKNIAISKATAPPKRISELKAHLQSLGATIDAIEASRAFRESGAANLSDKALIQALADVPKTTSIPITEYALIRALNEERAKSLSRELADTEAKAAIDRTDELLKQGRYDAAIKTVQPYRNKDTLSEQLQRDVNRVWLAAQADTNRREDSWTGSLWAHITDALYIAVRSPITLVCLLCGVLLVLRNWVSIGVTLKLPMRNKPITLRRPITAIALTDQTVSRPAGSAATPADDALTIAVRNRLEEIFKERNRTHRLERRGTEEGASVATLRPSMPATPGVSDLDSLMKGSGSISFGPIALNPVELIRALVRFVSPNPAQTISGSILDDSNGLRFVGRLTRQKLFGQKTVKEWMIVPHEQTDLNVREVLVAEMSAAIAYRLTISEDSQPDNSDEEMSFRTHHCALCILAKLRDEQSADRRKDLMRHARVELDRSLDYDPSNWMARLDLITLLRSVNEFHLALEQLALLECEIDKNTCPRLARGLEENPFFHVEIAYNIVLARMRTLRGKSYDERYAVIAEGLKHVRQLIDKIPPEKQTSQNYKARKYQLELLIHSVEAAGAVYAIDGPRFAGGRNENYSDNFVDARKQIFASDRFVTGHMPNYGDFGKELDSENMRVWILSRAAIENAKGRLYTKLLLKFLGAGFDSPPDVARLIDNSESSGTNDRATDANGSSICPLPNMIDAHISASDLNLKALEAYRGAISLSPDFVDAHTNLAAHYLLARHAADAEWTRHAENHLRAARSIDPDSLLVHYTLGKLYMDDSVGKYPEARTELKQARPYVFSYARLGKLALEQEGDYEDALENLLISLHLYWNIDKRIPLLITCLERMKQSNETQLPTLAQVQRATHLLNLTQKINEDTLSNEEKSKIDSLLEWLKAPKVKTGLAVTESKESDGQVVAESSQAPASPLLDAAASPVHAVVAVQDARLPGRR